MSYVYVCHEWPNAGVVKVGRSIDPINRMYIHGPYIWVDACFKLDSEHISKRVELDFHLTWRPLSLRITTTGRCEWYEITPEQAIKFIILYLDHHGLEYEDISALHGRIDYCPQGTDAALTKHLPSGSQW